MSNTFSRNRYAEAAPVNPFDTIQPYTFRRRQRYKFFVALGLAFVLMALTQQYRLPNVMIFSQHTDETRPGVVRYNPHQNIEPLQDHLKKVQKLRFPNNSAPLSLNPSEKNSQEKTQIAKKLPQKSGQNFDNSGIEEVEEKIDKIEDLLRYLENRTLTWNTSYNDRIESHNEINNSKIDSNEATNQSFEIKLQTIPQLSVKLTIEMVGNARLGNLIFGYASLLGIAKKNGLIPVIAKNQNMDILTETFSISTPIFYESTLKWESVEEISAGTFDKKMGNIARDMQLVHQRSGTSLPEGVVLKGYYQSWKYFHFMRDEIISTFNFQEQYKQIADDVISRARKQFRDPSKDQIVGMHIRRGDMITLSAQQRGYTLATAGYIKRAMKYIEYRLNNTEIVYVVCSEDQKWFKEKVYSDKLTKHPVIYSSFGHVTGAIDLAILSKCDHMIGTVGSYSWWASYFVNGIVVYYANFPAKNSPIDREYKVEDYFLPHWVPLT